MYQGRKRWSLAIWSVMLVVGCSAQKNNAPPTQGVTHTSQALLLTTPQVAIPSSVHVDPIIKPSSATALTPTAAKLPSTTTPKQNTDAEFTAYVETLKDYARENGISDATIKTAFTDIYHLQRVVNADKNQPERKATLNEYLNRVTATSRIQMAKAKLAEHRDAVMQAQKMTGVPAAYIIALWGVESGYGRFQGKEDVISALATLAFDGRREAFFKKELISALKILEKGYITKDKFKGSWAGAMGQCQFMPTSLLEYGRDGDGDGRVDIWNNKRDVLTSIGNYLATVGWQADGLWGNPVSLPAEFNLDLAGLDKAQAKTVAQWRALGINFADTKARPNDNTLAWLIMPDDTSRVSGYLVYSNFKTLMHWNRSYLFAISVGSIADDLMGQ